MTTTIITTSQHKKTFEIISNILLSIVFMLTSYFKYATTIPFLKQTYSETTGYIVLIIYLTLILVFILFYYLSRRRKTIGKLIVTEQTIEIETKNQSYEVKISDLNNFSVDSKYLRTRKEFASLAGSIDNWILFDFQNNKYNYQFAITSGYAGNKFRELIVDWSKNDNFKLINEK